MDIGYLLTTDPNVTIIWNQIKEWRKGGKKEVNASNIVTFVAILIRMIEKVITEPHSGPYKKQVLLAILGRVIQESKQPEEGKEALLALVDTIIPQVIDTSIAIAKGDIDIGKKIKKPSCCVSN